MAIENFSGVFVEGCLRAGVISKKVNQSFEIFKEIRVCKMAAFDILQEGW